MFKNLRKRINSVLPDIEGLHISSSAPSTSAYPVDLSPSSDQSRSKSAPWLHTTRVNSDAGCVLLEHNEKDWREIHARNESNAAKADLCDKLILNVLRNIETSARNMNEVELLLDNTQYLIQTINECSAVVLKINEACSDVERSLFDLEDLFEVLQLQERQLDSKFEMAMYKEQKLGELKRAHLASASDQLLWEHISANLEKTRQNLAVKHADAIRENERRTRAMQAERQSAFEDAFKSDLDYYKQVGKVPSELSHASAVL